MKRLFRIVLFMMPIASLLLCAATVLLWIKGNGPTNYIGMPAAVQLILSNNWLEVGSGEGELYVLVVNNVDMSRGAPPDSYGDTARLTRDPPAKYRLTHRFDTGSGYDSGWTIGELLYIYPLLQPNAHFSRWQHGDAFKMYTNHLRPPNGIIPTYRFLVLPCWLVVTLVALWPTFRTLKLTARTIRKRRRVRNGYCPTCGYDLRATPERCPECGDVPAKLG